MGSSLSRVALIPVIQFHIGRKAGRLRLPCWSCVELPSDSEFQMNSCLICIPMICRTQLKLFMLAHVS